MARKFVRTRVFGQRIDRAPKTIINGVAKQGHYLGIVPIKVGAFLLWPEDEIDKLLGEAPETAPPARSGQRKTCAEPVAA